MADLQLKHIYKRYAGGVTAVSDFTLDIDDKEFIILVGPSGCGKSTTLRMVAGLEEISEGELYIGGRLVNDVAPKDRDIAMVFQNYAIFPHLTVRDNVAFGLKQKNVPKEELIQQTNKYLELMQIAQYADRKPDKLSGGQQQRVALARALAPSPELILFDEPFSALDEHLRNQIRYDMLQVLRESGSSAIFVTHDRDEALCYADKIAVIQEGRILQIATPKTLYWSPQHLSIATFIGESIIFPATLKNDEIATCQLGEIAVENKGNGHTQGKVLFRPEQFSLAKKIQDPTASFKGEIKRIESRGRAINLCIDVGGYEFNLNEDLINHYQIGEHVTLYLYGKGVFYHH